MKKSLLLLSMGLLCLMARAIPADPTPVQVTQPDGTTLTVALHGDEFFHFTTTADGYTVLKNAAGYYTYARLDGVAVVHQHAHIARAGRCPPFAVYLRAGHGLLLLAGAFHRTAHMVLRSSHRPENGQCEEHNDITGAFHAAKLHIIGNNRNSFLSRILASY